MGFHWSLGIWSLVIPVRIHYCNFMSLDEVIILALVQGLTEFLPVSSSGHLLAARLLFGWTDTEGTAFDAFLHLGTLAAVLIYYRRVWWGIGRGLLVVDHEGQDKRELVAKLAVATVPGAVVGYFFQSEISAWLQGRVLLAVSFFITAGALYWFDVAQFKIGNQPTQPKPTIQPEKPHPNGRASFRDAIYIGLAQAVALVPGISRSGMTIAAGRWRGLSRKQAVNFSFLLSAPIIAGASLSSLAGLLINGSVSSSQLLVGFIVSFISGLAAMSLLLKIVEKMSFLPFVIYLAGLAALILVL